jgi:UPF0755 protein
VVKRGRAGESAGRGGCRLFAVLFGAAATLLVLALIAFVGGMAAYYAPGPRTADKSVRTVVLRPGAGLTEIGATLQRAHAVRSSALFMAAAQATGAARRLKPGEYAFPSGASLAQVLGKVRSGDIVHHRITIPEGRTSAQVVAALNASSVLVGEVATPAEGAILPETYDVVRGEQRAAVLQRMMDARDRLLADLWAKRRQGLPYDTPAEAVTLASIVEKETSLASERPRVAAVYVNRLRIGMKLDADPTLVYGITGGEPLGRGLRMSELLADVPYNTYQRPGLPPTPIANPGRDSLAAVMDPPDTTELYFVASGTGGHLFASTLAQQAANVAKYRAWEAERARARAAAQQAQAEAAPAPKPKEHR